MGWPLTVIRRCRKRRNLSICHPGNRVSGTHGRLLWRAAFTQPHRPWVPAL